MKFNNCLSHLRNLRILLILLLIIVNCSQRNLVVDENKDNKIVLPDGYEERWFEGLRYGLFVPPSYDSAISYPLIIRLHGYTDTTSWNLNWYNQPIVTNDPCIVYTPKSSAYRAWGTSWVETTPEPLKLALQVFDSLQSEFNIDTTRIYIHGSSMGGFGVFNLLNRYPQRFAAAIAICGGGSPETAEQVMQTPLWLFHGTEDSVVNISNSKNIYNRIIELGGELTRYTEYPGVGHAAWTPAWQESTLVDWFLAQRRGQSCLSPDSIMNLNYVIEDSNHIRLSWDKVKSEKNTNNWIWYIKLYKNGQLFKELDPNNTAFIDSSEFKGTECRYSIQAVNYYFKKSLKREIVVTYSE